MSQTRLVFAAFVLALAQACSGSAAPAAAPPDQPEEKLDAAPSNTPPPKKDGPTVTPPTPDTAPAALPRGSGCTTGSQCASGSCVDSVCCESACTGTCMTCKLPGSEGKCLPAADGEDPHNDCAEEAASTCKKDGMCDGKGACRYHPAATECAPSSCAGAMLTSARTCDGMGICQPAAPPKTCAIACMNGSCNETCSAAAPCPTGFFCDPAGTCKAKSPPATACTTNDECATGFCADGVCCRTACGTTCSACNLPATAGTCTIVPDGQDPKKECVAEAATTCGRAGGCDGNGGCKLFTAGTACGPQTCTGATENGAKTCNGAGTCVAADMTSCSPFRCGTTMCRTTCTTNSHCDLGFICMQGSCNQDPASDGLVLRWSFDETSGTTAQDVSGHMHPGNYVGTTGTPTASTNVPKIGQDNPRSRAFTRNNRHAVQLPAMPAELMPANDFTVAGWYRATSVDTSGAEIVSAGNNYLIRLRPTQVEFAKRYTSPQNTTATAQVFGTVVGMLSGAWHHVAGVASSADGMKLYVDGKLVQTEPTFVQDVLYDNSGQDFWVGRHGNGSQNWDFQGNIDDVRVYDKALTDEEIQRLVSGPPGVEILIHWRFDETAGNVAADDSDFGFNGTYTGATTSLDHAPVSFVNPRSRRFTRANRQNVRLTPMPVELQPANNITLSAWYKATSVDTAGAEIISGRNSYVLRLLPTQIEFSKRYTNAAGNGATTSLKSPDLAGAHLNGQWHHVAASTGPSGTKVYFDGKLQNMQANRIEDLRYDQGADFWVARNGNNQATFDFEGNIDDVTVFGRELGEDEVLALAEQNGTPSPELALYWDFEETTGTVARDQTTNNLNGTYVGAPTAQTDVPGLVNDVRSRHFTRGTPRQAVQLIPLPDALKPINDLTVSVWYKSGALAAGATEELVSAGDNYLLRLSATQVQLTKNTTTGFANCAVTIPQAKHLDGMWHHLAGTSASGVQMRLYFDGVEQTCPNTALTRADIDYTMGTEFWVGRHGNGQTTRDFDGNIDEVRIYRRALTQAEISELANQATQTLAPALHWKFSETSGTTAADSSANNLDGTYVGDNATFPTPDPLTPGSPQGPRALAFNGVNRQAVQRAAMPPALTPAEITVAAWYHATAAQLDTGGAEIISGGDHYVLRLRPMTGATTGVEFAKTTGAGLKRCTNLPANYLDGGWHHLAATSSAATGLVLYVDGQKVCDQPADNQAITYTGAGADFWVGRHGNGQDQWDFTGSIDDVRVYGSALTEAQINAIIAGTL